jgi:hypothetical protein
VLQLQVGKAVFKLQLRHWILQGVDFLVDEKPSSSILKLALHVDVGGSVAPTGCFALFGAFSLCHT